MGMAKKIRILLIEKETTMASLAKKLGKTGATMSEKMKRDNFSEKDLIEIAKALDCEYKAFFVTEEGKEI